MKDKKRLFYEERERHKRKRKKIRKRLENEKRDGILQRRTGRKRGK